MIIKSIKERVKEHFFVNPTAKLRVREIERALNLPLPSIIRYCKELEKEGILTKQEIGTVVFYTADRANESFLLGKKFFNLKILYESGLVKYLKTELHNPGIIVFGSYSKGEDIEGSDVDLYIETLSKKEIELAAFEKALKRRIQLFTFKNLREVKNVHLANNIINGIVLNGFVEVFK